MYKAQYKTLVRTYLMIIFGILGFSVYVFIKNKAVFNLDNLNINSLKSL